MFNRQTLIELQQQIENRIETQLPGSDPRLKRSVLSALAHTMAAASHGMHGHLVWNSEQILPDSAAEEMLIKHADEWLDGGRKDPQPSKGLVKFSGTAGTNIPAGTVVQRSDGWQFTTDSSVTLSITYAWLDVTAVEPGADSNTSANTQMTMVNPIPNISSTVVVDANGLTGGADIEDLESLRERIRFRIQNPPHGGNAADYVAWAREVPNVTRAWSFPNENGLGTVVVRFMMDDIYPDGIPIINDVVLVASYIYNKRPVGVTETIEAPTAVPLNPTIQLTPSNDQTVKDAVEAELQDMLLRDAEPGGTILISRIHEAISIAAGETDHVLVSPAANVTHTTSEIATLGTITWQ